MVLLDLWRATLDLTFAVWLVNYNLGWGEGGSDAAIKAGRLVPERRLKVVLRVGS